MNTRHSEKQNADSFDRLVPSVVLNQQTMFEAFAEVFESTRIPVSVERILGTGDASRTDRKFKATIPEGKLSVVLDEICALDGTYTWSRDGNMVNVYPRGSVRDARYLFNRRIPELHLGLAPNASGAVIQAVDSLPGPRAQLIVLVPGGPDQFSSAWTVTFENLTLRHAINRIAEHLCDTCGWQLTGTKATPTLMFYRSLQP